MFEELRESQFDGAQRLRPGDLEMSKKWNEESLLSNTNNISLYSKRNGKLEILKRGVACSNVSIFKNPYGDCVG